MTRISLHTRGFSLVESLVWIAMFTAVMLAIVSSVISFYRTSDIAIQEGNAVTSAQRGIDAMVRSIREASFATDGAYPIASIASTSLTFYATMSGGAYYSERVRYYLDGTRLMQGTIMPAGNPPAYITPETTKMLSENVSNIAQNVPLFSYFDKNGTQIDYSRVSDVRFVTITLLVSVVSSKASSTVRLRSSAALRNLAGQ